MADGDTRAKQRRTVGILVSRTYTNAGLGFGRAPIAGIYSCSLQTRRLKDDEPCYSRQRVTHPSQKKPLEEFHPSHRNNRVLGLDDLGRYCRSLASNAFGSFHVYATAVI